VVIVPEAEEVVVVEGTQAVHADSEDTAHTSPPRRSTRQRCPPDRYGPYISHWFLTEQEDSVSLEGE